MATPPELSVILPTLDEREALERLDPRLRAGTSGRACEVIVVDDASTDGTPAFVESLARDGPYRLIERRNARGLASAVVEGLRAARGRVLVVLDADGSHPPERIPALVGPIFAGSAEFVLGSRNVPGGSAPGLSFGRRAISFGAALLARPLSPVRDPMSGYFAVARSVVDRAPLAPVGYKIALEILVKCRPSPVLEVPIVFAPRVAGESKLGGGEIGAYLHHLERLYAWRIFRRGRRAGAGPTSRSGAGSGPPRP